MSNSSLAVVQHEGEYAIKLIDEIFNIAKLLKQVKKDFTVRTCFKGEAVLLLDVLVVVDFSVGHQGQVTFPHWLVTRFRDVVDSQPVEAHQHVITYSLELGVVWPSTVLFLELIPKISVAESVELFNSVQTTVLL